MPKTSVQEAVEFALHWNGPEAFQRNRSLPSDPLGLNGPFWEELVVPVKPGLAALPGAAEPTAQPLNFPQGDESAAVLALRWMLQSTSQARSLVAAFGHFD